jgi:hypothetical protein
MELLFELILNLLTHLPAIGMFGLVMLLLAPHRRGKTINNKIHNWCYAEEVEAVNLTLPNLSSFA